MTCPRPRGSSLITVVILMGVLLFMVVGVLAYAGLSHRHAIQEGRKTDRYACASAGVQLARSYFGNKYGSWNTYLADPTHYNASSPTTTVPVEYEPLYADLDSDGLADVYLYIRDNADELPPLVDDATRDNDQNVVIGARCISTTLRPRMENGAPVVGDLVAEGLLQYNIRGTTYTALATGGASGDGNLNDQ